VLLTGATGFLGRRIQRALLADGRALRVLVRPGSPSRRHVDARCEIHETELSGERDLDPALHGCRAVVYCAGSVRGRTLDDFLPANVEGVRNILRAAARRDSAPPFLLISSLAAGRADDLVEELAQRLGIDRDEVRTAIADALESWHREARRIGDQTGGAASRVALDLGVATREAVDELELRVAQLEHRLKLLEKRS